MAIVRIKGTVGTQLANGTLLVDPAVGVAPTPDTLSTTAVDGDVTTLVADGATPTQAHVTALSGHWTTLKAAVAAQSATEVGDVVVSYDTTKITTKTQLKQALAAILRAVEGTSLLT